MKKTGPTFWHSYANPIVGLSPMDGVTDFPYRAIQKKYGNPDILYTEFTNVEGLCHGASQLLKDFEYDEAQRNIVAQIYGLTPEYFRQVATIVCELGFDGIDLNMGCPAKNVASSGAGAALIKTPDLAKEIYLATKAGVTDYFEGKRAKDCKDISAEIAHIVSERAKKIPAHITQRTTIPVSIKTRVGYDQPVTTEWISFLLELEPAAIALHGRTLKQQYSGLSSWEEIAVAAQLANKTNTLLLGNGDIQTLEDAHKKITDYDLDGVLIGRGSFGNPFIFKEEVPADAPSLFAIALEHSFLFQNTYQDSDRYNFLPMRKHLGWYVKGIENAKEVRIKLFQSNSAEDVQSVLMEYNLV